MKSGQSCSYLLIYCLDTRVFKYPKTASRLYLTEEK